MTAHALLSLALMWNMSSGPAAELKQYKAERILTWFELADCESGDWINRGEDFVPFSADWSSDVGTFEGGLQFHPKTWDWLRPDDFPDSAADATAGQEMYVAERVLEIQGWRAWPVCSRLIGRR